MTDTPTDTPIGPLDEALAAHVHANELIDALKHRDPAEPLRVSAPNTEFDGFVGDMRFTKGVYAGLVDDAAIVYLLNAGYTVEPAPAVEPITLEPAEVDQAAFDLAVDAAVEAKVNELLTDDNPLAEQIETRAEARAEQLVAERLDAAVEAAIKDRGLVPKSAARKTTQKEGAGQ